MVVNANEDASKVGEARQGSITKTGIGPADATLQHNRRSDSLALLSPSSSHPHPLPQFLWCSSHTHPKIVTRT